MHTQHQHRCLKRYIILRGFLPFQKTDLIHRHHTTSKLQVFFTLSDTMKAKDNPTNTVDDKILHENFVQAEEILRNQKQCEQNCCYSFKKNMAIICIAINVQCKTYIDSTVK